jgi:hypothetical protein
MDRIKNSRNALNLVTDTNLEDNNEISSLIPCTYTLETFLSVFGLEQDPVGLERTTG